MSKPGQSNLFSFFTKKKPVPICGGGIGGVCASASQPKESPLTPAPAAKSAVVSTVTPTDVVKAVYPAVVASSFSLAPSPEGSEYKMKRAQGVGAASSKRKARAELESDKEDEWDGEESGSEASVGGDGDNSEDDDDFLADSDEDGDEGEGGEDDDSAMSESESEDEAPKRVKKKNQKKSTQAVAAQSSSKTKRARLGTCTTTPTGSSGATSKASASLTLPSGDVNGRTMSLDMSGGGGKGKPADMDALYLADRMLAEPPAASQKQSQCVANDHMVRVLPSGVCGQGCHEHDLLDWLTPALRKDAQRRPMSHPDYNPRTLYVPSDFMKAQTPGHTQWWELKSTNMDTVLFFKVHHFSIISYPQDFIAACSQS